MPRKTLSYGEEMFAFHCKAEKLQPVREYQFTPDRKYRLDFAFPDHKIGVEIEGGIWIKGRHNRGTGFQADLEKYNLATQLGWRIMRYSTEMVESGSAIIQVVEMARRVV